MENNYKSVSYTHLDVYKRQLLSGKVKMAYHHMFDGCDAAVSWHPSDTNMAHDQAYLANASAHFYFHRCV